MILRPTLYEPEPGAEDGRSGPAVAGSFHLCVSICRMLVVIPLTYMASPRGFEPLLPP